MNLNYWTNLVLFFSFFSSFPCGLLFVHGFTSSSFASSSAELIHDNLLIFNQQLANFKRLASEIAWNISLSADQRSWELNENLALQKNMWNNKWCKKLIESTYRPDPDKIMRLRDARQIFLTCRGARFTPYQLSNILSILTEMQTVYNQMTVFSMRMEPDLNNFMETTRNEQILRSAWTQWHQTVGSEVKPLYINLIQMLNQGARSSGLADMGESWRQEMEMTNLKPLALKLYSEVKYLYSLLHSFVRFKLKNFYRMDINSTIPVHLLGNMWAQRWDSLFDILFPEDETNQGGNNPLVDELVNVRSKNASVLDMVKTAEDLFVSMGFPKLPPKFYTNSYFTEDSRYPTKNCHGTAANMFNDDDYRIMMCANKKQLQDEDLITLTHEMGHVYYFMAYSHLEYIFQDGANSAFHESVGDSITYGLKPNKMSHKNGSKIKSLLKVALTRLPQIGYGLIMDLWRWNVFENENSPETWNADWWQLNKEFLGIEPPANYDTEKGLDATAKYHVIDNIPYIRYFMASFIQLQFFESYCQGYDNIHDCELWGNKIAGSKLWNMMRKGSSEHWSSVLKDMTGSDEILSGPLLRYFEPVKIWLEAQVAMNNLTVGW